jgi:transcription factor SPT20
MAGSNRTRAVDDLLARTRDDPPSFTVHLHQEHWILNNGSKFLYHNQTAVRLISPLSSFRAQLVLY